MDTHARLSPRRGLGLMTAVAAVALVAGQLAFASTGAATVGPTSVGVAIAPPSDAGSSPGAVAAAVACAAPGSCFQVGTYTDAGGYTRPSLGVITDGNAEQTFSLSTYIPSNGLTTPSNDYLSAISCPNVGQCEAVGSYQLTAGGSGGYALEWDNFGDYYIPNSSIQQITLPLDSASPPQAALYGISCTTIGNCVAVGTYSENGVGHVPLVAVQTNGTWATGFTPASEPAGFSTGTLSAVSCPSASNCVAVGTINTSSGGQAIYYEENAGIWQSSPTVVPLPNDKASSNPFGKLNAVSCVSPGTCEAVGSYYNSTASTEPLTVQQVAGAWQASGTVALPGDAVSPADGELYGVSCITTDGLCEAVGYYAIASSGDNAMTVLDRGGTWRGGQTVPEPVAVGATVPADFLYGVTCQQSGSCAAVGNFVNFLSQYQPMWAPVTTPPSPVTSISEVPTSLSEANVTWTPSVVTGAGIDHFEVYESVDGGVNYADLGSSGTATTMHVTGLVPGHVYHFEVVAVDVALVGSGPTYSTYTQAVPPSAPRSLHATVMHHGASLTWSAPASNGFAPITSYTVTVTWPGGHTVKVVTSAHLALTGLLHTRTYGFSVRAANRAGPGPSSQVVHFVPGV